MEVTAATPLWIASRVLLLERGDDFFRRWKRAGKTTEVEDIHDLRVASRRLREALALFLPCFPAKSLTRLTARVKRLTGLLGAMRNTDEALLYFTPLVATLPGESAAALGELLGVLQQERKRERRALLKGLQSIEPRQLRDLFEDACNRPLVFQNPAADSFQPVSAFLRDKLQERAQPVMDLLPEARLEANVAAQHRLRIAVKRLRYRFELAEQMVSSGYAELYTALKGYQELLGKMHDLDVFADLVRQRLADAAAEELGEVIARQRTERFARFTSMLAETPLPELGERMRGLL
jgi:CHAD domain-containing protein